MIAKSGAPRSASAPMSATSAPPIHPRIAITPPIAPNAMRAAFGLTVASAGEEEELIAKLLARRGLLLRRHRPAPSDRARARALRRRAPRSDRPSPNPRSRGSIGG